MSSADTPVHIRDAVRSLPGYVPGARPGGGRTAKLSSNELPFPPQPAVLEALTAAATGANRYPEMTADSLVAALARRHGVDAEHTRLTCLCEFKNSAIFCAFCECLSIRTLKVSSPWMSCHELKGEIVAPISRTKATLIRSV